MLKSSIMGREFVNYRKTTMKGDRVQFSESVRSQGIGYIPIVVDSVDPELSVGISPREKRKTRKYGKEISLHMDKTLRDVLKEVKIILLQNDYEHVIENNVLNIGLEDGSIPNPDMDIGSLYKQHRNKDDRILYLLITKEETTYGYILSIINYLKNTFTSFITKYTT